eukprot:jgi/Mesvir1/20801/Mv07905-RA.1
MAKRFMDPLQGLSSDDEDSDEDRKPDSNDGETPTADAGEKDPPRPKGTQKLDFEALSRHGYKGGPSVLYVPPPKAADVKGNWEWGHGTRQKRGGDGEDDGDDHETFEERERTRRAAGAGVEEAAALANKQAQVASELREAAKAEALSRKAAAESFNKKEQRKRKLGQTSRGTSYVEEEKRHQRDFGVFSGFD